jgi:hypothetical protein
MPRAALILSHVRPSGFPARPRAGQPIGQRAVVRASRAEKAPNAGAREAIAPVRSAERSNQPFRRVCG